MSKKTHAESEVERIAQRLWKRALRSPGRQYEVWSEVKHHLWGLSDGMHIAGWTAAAKLADDLGFLAGERSVIGFES